MLLCDFRIHNSPALTDYGLNLGIFIAHYRLDNFAPKRLNLSHTTPNLS
nr:hypothetical protein [Campylobacter sp.]